MSQPSPAASLSAFGRATYAVGQAARVGLYFGQYLLSQRLTRPLPAARRVPGPFPGQAAILKDLRALFARDLANIEAGRYRPPADLASAPFAALRRAAAFFADLPAVERRRHIGAGQEVWQAAPRPGYPRYYQQNFHFQSDGWFSPRSAALYDHQVEVLFGGGADAMRRQALLPLRQALDGRPQQAQRLLDLGCGTGRFLAAVKDNWPRLAVCGLDLAPDYLALAAQRLRPFRRWQLLQAPAERLPFAAESFDAVSALFLFHELPRGVRQAVVREAARVLRPGGTLILLDSIQRGDVPAYDPLLELFPIAFHEPYYADYVRQDLDQLFASAGFRRVWSEVAYFARVLAYAKPAS